MSRHACEVLSHATPGVWFVTRDLPVVMADVTAVLSSNAGLEGLQYPKVRERLGGSGSACIISVRTGQIFQRRRPPPECASFFEVHLSTRGTLRVLKRGLSPCPCPGILHG